MKYTLHNDIGWFMHVSARTLKVAKEKADKANFKCIVREEYLKESVFGGKTTKHAKEVYRNF